MYKILSSASSVSPASLDRIIQNKKKYILLKLPDTLYGTEYMKPNSHNGSVFISLLKIQNTVVKY